MDANKVYNKLVNFALQEISFSEFQEMLFSSSKSNPVRVGWETLEGNNRYYWMYWDSAAYVGNEVAKKIKISKSTTFLAVKKIRKYLEEVIENPFKDV